MTLVLSHISALEHYRTYGGFYLGGFAPASALAAQPPQTVPKREATKVLQQPPNVYEVRDVLSAFGTMLSDPLHVVVATQGLQRSIDRVACHVGSGGPFASQVVKANSLYYACSPVLALAQCTQLCPTAQVAQWCSEFCGTYRLSQDSQGFNKALPLVSRQQIRRFAQDYSQVAGCSKLRRIAQYVPDGAASPMETALVELLCLPVRWGGYGLPIPKLNARIDLPRDICLRTGKNYFVADLLWSSKRLVVEYDSNEFHAGKERISSDADRRNILASLGYTVVTVVSNQLYSANKADELARQLLKHLGARRYPPKNYYSSQRHSLRQTLLFGRA